jgi:hypothetical protein
MKNFCNKKNMNVKKIVSKPHHFLDVIKLYGAGLEKFVPDLAYGHDFYRIGNIILEDPNVEVELTLKADDICNPCKYSRDGKCDDTTFKHPAFPSKEVLNNVIDKRLFEILGLEEGNMIKSLELCELAKERLSREKIMEVWEEQPTDITEKRIELLVKGLDKYIRKNTANKV